MKQRNNYIDLAKGFCILFVVYWHVLSDYVPPILTYIALPLFFFVSGYFFNKTINFRTFLTKKVNTLLIPYYFFSLPNLFFFILMWVKNKENDLSEIYELSKSYHNSPIWFLLSLFWTTIFFYCIINKKRWIEIICVSLLTITGLLLNINEIKLPFNLSGAINAIPFFYSGYIIHNYNLLDKVNNKTTILSGVMLIISSIFINLSNEFSIADYTSVQLYSIPIICSLGIAFSISLCKQIGNIPPITYFGRNLLIVLGTHLIFVRLAAITIPYSIISNLWFRILFLIVIIALTYPIIEFSKKYIPKFCGYEPLIKNR